MNIVIFGNKNNSWHFHSVINAAIFPGSKFFICWKNIRFNLCLFLLLFQISFIVSIFCEIICIIMYRYFYFLFYTVILELDNQYYCYFIFHKNIKYSFFENGFKWLFVDIFISVFSSYQQQFNGEKNCFTSFIAVMRVDKKFYVLFWVYLLLVFFKPMLIRVWILIKNYDNTILKWLQIIISTKIPSELTPVIFNTELTHLGSEASNLWL